MSAAPLFAGIWSSSLSKGTALALCVVARTIFGRLFSPFARHVKRLGGSELLRKRQLNAGLEAESVPTGISGLSLPGAYFREILILLKNMACFASLTC